MGIHKEGLQFLSPEEFQKLKYYLDQNETLQALSVSLLLHTGMKQDELVRLKANSFDLRLCKIATESNKVCVERMLYFHPMLKPKLKQLIEQLGSKKTIGKLLSNSDSPASQKRTFLRVFNRVLLDALGPNDFSPHALRDTYALRMLSKLRGDILGLQVLLGHRNAANTLKYLSYWRNEQSKRSWNQPLF